MNGTFTFNVVGAPNMGFDGGNVATAIAGGLAKEHPIDPRYLRIASGANRSTKTRIVSCIEIRLFGRTF